MAGALEFWFEFASTYSYPAAQRVAEVASARGVEVVWRPFLLGPIFGEQGWSDSPFNLYPAKGRYMWRDLERVCEAEGLPWRKPSAFPRNGLHAARVACCFQDEPWQPDFVRAVYAASFAEDRDPADHHVLAELLARLGQPADEVLAASTEPDAKQKLRAQTESAAGHGIFGAPSFRAGDELYWGNDRLEEAVARAAAG